MRKVLFCATVFAFLYCGACFGANAQTVSPYMYQDTRQLVKFVEDAATLIEQKGHAAFAIFTQKDARWQDKERYLFVYTENGTCVFHPVTPELLGKNLLNLKDMNGKPVIAMICAVARQPKNDASGWVFYLWEEQTQFNPRWKGSYIRKAVSPDGKIYVVGSGSYNLKIEKNFVSDIVDAAVQLLKTKGKTQAFSMFLDPASQFNLMDSYVFVLDENGCTLVDPAFPTIPGRDLNNMQDVVGKHVVKEILDKLRLADRAWVQYLMPRPGSVMPSRKLAYVRKVQINGQNLVVGLDFFEATPVWMNL
jgi:signal transduction histidine kinase